MSQHAQRRFTGLGSDRRENGQGTVPCVEPLERRRLFSITFANGVLTIVGTDGPDDITLQQTDGNVEVNFDGDRDTVPASGVGAIVINALGGNDIVSLSTVTAPATILGGDGDDVFFLGSGPTSVAGGAGNDTYELAPDWGPTLVNEGPGGGIDELDFSKAPDGLTFDFASGVVTDGRKAVTAIGGEPIERFTGSKRDDRFVFSPNVPSKDSIDGGGGSDTFDYSAYATPVAVDLGSKTLYEAEFTDSTTGIYGDSQFLLDPLTGQYRGGFGVLGPAGIHYDSVSILDSPSNGNRLLLPLGSQPDFSPVGRQGFQRELTGTTSDLLKGALEGEAAQFVVDVSDGSGGSQVLAATFHAKEPGGNATGVADIAGIDNVIGGMGNDTIIGNDRANLIRGRGGDDDIAGRGGPDDLGGNRGNDTIVGNGGNDFIAGGPGNDSLAGGAGDDQIAGQGGDDTLRGGIGNDTLIAGLLPSLLIGGPGDDLFYAHDGQPDTLIGGDGNNIAYIDGLDQMPDADIQVLHRS